MKQKPKAARAASHPIPFPTQSEVDLRGWIMHCTSKESLRSLCLKLLDDLDEGNGKSGGQKGRSRGT